MSSIKVERAKLQDLPDHVLEKIVSGLESRDLINLLNSAPNLHHLFNNSYQVVTDLVDDLYTSLSKDFYITVDEALRSEETQNFKGTLLLECHDIESSWPYFFELINALSQETSCQITVYNTTSIPVELQEEFHRVCALTAREPGFIKLIHIPELKTLHFLVLSWDPSVFKLPKITYLGLGDTTIVDNGLGKPHFPKLEQLYIEGSLGGDLSILELPNTVHFNEVLKQFDIQDLKSDALEFLRIESSDGISKIDNIDFPNLKQFEVINSNVPRISNVKANNLINLIHESSYFSAISFDNIEARGLQQIEITGTFIDHVTNVTFPELQYVSLKLFEQPIPDEYSTPFKFLEDVKIIEITNSIQALEGLNLQKLNVLNLHDDTTYRLTSNTKFPELEKILIAHNEVIQQVPFINAPKLQEITVIGSFNFISINNLATDYPSLRSVVIDNCALSVVTNLKFPNLEVLEIQSDVNEMIFTHNKFPKLKELSLSPKDNHLTYGYLRTILQFEQIDAPVLEKLTLTGINIDSKFSTEAYPNIVELSIDTVSDLEVTTSDKLTLLNLSYNHSIRNLELGQLKNLVEFYPPKSIDDKTLEWVENLKKSIAEDVNTTAENLDDLKI